MEHLSTQDDSDAWWTPDQNVQNSSHLRQTWGEAEWKQDPNEDSDDNTSESCTSCNKTLTECDCPKCGTCFSSQHECLCLHDCGQENCDCDFCKICRKDICDCPDCKKCTRKVEVCICAYCAVCDSQGMECKCPDCSVCGERHPLCVCEPCRVCQKIMHPRNPHETDPCVCQPCKICQRDAHDCTCCSADIKVHWVDFKSKKIQVVKPEQYAPQSSSWWSDRDQAVTLRGTDFQVIVIPTWSGVKAKLKRRFRESSINRTSQSALRRGKEISETALTFFQRPAYVDVENTQDVRRMLRTLARVPAGEPNLGIDLEGVDLGRNGKTCYLQVRDYFHKETYLIDLLALAQTAFSTAYKGTTLKTILEDPDRTKLIWDCRQDSDSLCHHFGVKLRGVLDLQLMVLLLRQKCPKRRMKLEHAMLEHANFSDRESEKWKQSKAYPFAGNYELLSVRPCPEAVKTYAVNDVAFLRRMYCSIKGKLTDRATDLASEWTEIEIEDMWKVDWVSTRASIRAGFEKCWNEDLHQGGFQGIVCDADTDYPF